MVNRPGSVVFNDAEALHALFTLHAPEARTILDVTYGSGRIWRNYLPPCRLYASDIRSLPGLDFHFDYTNTAGADMAGGYGAGLHQAFDVIVFDPPHISEAKGGISGEKWADGYGTLTEASGKADISGSFEGFLLTAARFLKPNGVVFAKIGDQVHRGKQRLQHVMLINEAERHGFTACDLLVMVRNQVGDDPKWKNAYHARKGHTFWLCLRKGKRCHR